MNFLMVFDFTEFWLDGRPGNEYFWISNKISGHLTPMTPLGVHQQWFETTWNRYKRFLLLWQDQFGPTLNLAPSILWHEAHFSPKNTSAPIIIQPDAYFGQEILQPKTTLTQYTSTQEPKSSKVSCCAFHRFRGCLTPNPSSLDFWNI